MSAAPTDDLDAVVVAVAAAPRPVLVGLDLDGTLSSIAPHRDEAVLAPGAAAALVRLSGVAWAHVVVVTGRGRADAIGRFSLPEPVVVIGSHGAEGPDGERPPVDDAVLAELAAAAETAVREVGAGGAWVEHKPMSVTLHVRQADPDPGARALVAFRAAAVALGCVVLDAHAALEASPVRLDKGDAVMAARDRTGSASICYVGDDATDERVFERLAPPDVAVKVGAGPTGARFRLGSPERVVRLLERLQRLQRRTP